MILKSRFVIAMISIVMIGMISSSLTEVDAVLACDLMNLNGWIMKSAEPKICERVNYWVHYECGRVPGLYLTDARCQPPAGFPLERLERSGSFMELNLDKEIYKMGDSIEVYGNAYSSVGLPTGNLGIKITNSDGKKILEYKNNFDKSGKFGFNILTGTTISINDEGNYELYVVHYGKYGSSAIKKFTVSNDGLPIVVPTVVTSPPTVVTSPPTVVTSLPTVVSTQDPQPFTTNWMTIGAILIVITVVGYLIYKKVTRSGFSKISTNYSNTKEEHNNDSSTKEEPHDNSKQNKNPMHPTNADLKNNFKRFTWEDAEDLTALLFKAKGYSTKVGVPTKDEWKRKRNGDHGIDVRAEIDKTTTGIQVKHWESNVDEDSVIKTNGSSQIFDRVIIISTKKGFEKNAKIWANLPGNAEKMDLWDCHKFKEEIKKHLIEKDNSQFEEPKIVSDFNYYEILGVSQNATQEEIKNNFKKISKNSHPDVNPSLQSETFMKNINIAYDTLSDIEKRKKYDLDL